MKKEYTIETLVNSDDFAQYKDLILANYSKEDIVTKDKLKRVIKSHLEREVK